MQVVREPPVSAGFRGSAVALLVSLLPALMLQAAPPSPSPTGDPKAMPAGQTSPGPSAVAPAPSAGDIDLRIELPLSTPRSRDPVLGGTRDKVFFRVWIPAGVEVVRGGICNPFSKDEAPGRHWQAACRHWRFACVATDFDGVKKEDHALLEQALAKLAAAHARPELEHLPLCFIGMSRGGGMSMALGERLPDRTIAVAPVCLEVGPASEAARQIPVLTVFGEKDGRQKDQLLAKLPVQRKDGARWALAIQWGRGHEFALANNIAVPFFDDVIRLRLPEDPVPAGKPVPLRPVAIEAGRLADTASWGKGRPTVAAPAEFKGDPATACWLPTARTAAVWQSFTAPSKDVRITEPPGLGDKQPFLLHKAGQPVVVKAALGAVVKPASVALMDGDVVVAEKTAGPWEFSVTLTAGVHPLIVVTTDADGTVRLSRPHTVLVGP